VACTSHYTSARLPTQAYATVGKLTIMGWVRWGLYKETVIV